MTTPGHFKARYDLPATVCRDIGRIITRWAYVERYLQGIVYMLAGVSAPIGRLAMREPNALQRLDLVLDLLAARGLKAPSIDVKTLRGAMEDAQDMRNIIAHAGWVWSAEHQAWVVHVARGTWSGIPKAEQARRNKRIFPEGQILRPHIFKGYIAGIDGIIQQLREMQAEIEKQIRDSQN